MQTIAVVNKKGGSTKSSVCLHLGGTLAKLGRNVLLVDMDPQGSLTQGIIGTKAFESLSPRVTTAEIWDGSPLPEQVVHLSGFSLLSLIPAHEDSTDANMIPRREWGDRIYALRSLLFEVREDFDFALVDCPPNIHLCSWASLVASDYVLTPLLPEDFGSQGLVSVNRAVRAVQDQHGCPQILGYLLSMVDKRLAIHQAYESSLRQIYGEMVFDTTIPYATQYKESVAARTPISHYKPRSAAAKAYAALADEIEAILEARRVAPNAA